MTNSLQKTFAGKNIFWMEMQSEIRKRNSKFLSFSTMKHAICARSWSFLFRTRLCWSSYFTPRWDSSKKAQTIPERYTQSTKNNIHAWKKAAEMDLSLKWDKSMGMALIESDEKNSWILFSTVMVQIYTIWYFGSSFDKASLEWHSRTTQQTCGDRIQRMTKAWN